MRILDRLIDTPAEVVSELGETLHQTPLAAALLGDARGRVGIERSIAYRWFTEPSARLLYAEEDRDALGRLWAANLRRVVGERGPDSRAARVAGELARTATSSADSGRAGRWTSAPRRRSGSCIPRSARSRSRVRR